MFTTHVIKLKEQYCDPVYFGDKTFEVRKNDRGYQKGDHIIFEPVDEYGTLRIDRAIEKEEYVITCVHSGFGLEEGFVVLGIANVDPTQTLILRSNVPL